MYLQTTKNSRNALYCHIATSSKDNLPYSTRSTLDYRYCKPDDMEEMDQLESQMRDTSVQQGEQLPNRLAQTQVNFETAKKDLLNMSEAFSQQHSNQSQQHAVDSSRGPPIRRKTTKIFDGALLEKARKQAPKRTFRSKRESQERGGRQGKREMFLPEVAVAIKMHQRAKELVEKQR